MEFVHGAFEDYYSIRYPFRLWPQNALSVCFHRDR